MKKVKNAKIGQVVQVPTYEFAPLRRGFNGWLFNVGIIKAFGKSKSGLPIIKVEYPAKSYAQRLHNIRGEECGFGDRKTLEKWFLATAVFETDLTFQKNQIEHPREYYTRGCYCEDVEFLIDKGVLKIDAE